MDIRFSIGETDYVTHQLYTASKSERIVKKRTRSKIVFPILYVLFALWGLFKIDYIFAVMFLVLALLWYVFYPLWESRYYKKHYQSFIKENYQNKCDITVELTFDNHFLFLKDHASESKIQTSEIEVINDIPTVILIKLKTGGSIILPKDKITGTELSAVIDSLKELSATLCISYNQEPDWYWK